LDFVLDICKLMEAITHALAKVHKMNDWYGGSVTYFIFKTANWIVVKFCFRDVSCKLLIVFNFDTYRYYISRCIILN
jgi:hypothetical protein